MAEILALLVPLMILVLPLFWLFRKIGVFRGFWPGFWAGLFTRIFVGSLRRRRARGRMSRTILLAIIALWCLAIIKVCRYLG
jgi:hypothetical protein